MKKDRLMYIAMNRFQVVKGKEDEFEAIWRSRDKHLAEVPGFQQFHLLRGPVGEDFTLYASHTIWREHKSFLAWTKSDAFKKAHAHAGDHKSVYLGHPSFEGFDSIDGI